MSLFLSYLSVCLSYLFIYSQDAASNSKLESLLRSVGLAGDARGSGPDTQEQSRARWVCLCVCVSMCVCLCVFVCIVCVWTSE